MSMEHKHFLVIDNGGTNTKVIILDEVGNQLSVVSFPTDAVERRPGFREVNPQQMWRDIGKATNSSLMEAGLSGDQIDAVVPVGHGKGLYMLDKEGKPSMDCILSSDSRASDLADAFEARVGEIYPISHQHVMVMQFPVLLRWIKEHEPQKYASIGHVLSNKDFIRFMLTGEIWEEQGDASGNNLVNLETGEYDPQLFDFFGIPEMLPAMPQLVHATDQCGSICEQASKNTGIAVGTPVFAGMFDIDACAIATGVLDEDLFSVTAGTWNINVFPSKTKAAQSSGCMNSLFPTGDVLVEASSPTSAGNLDNMLRMLSKDGRQAIGYDELEKILSSSDARNSTSLFFPFLYGSNVNLGAEGALIGMRSSDSFAQIIRAVYEGVAFAHRQHVDQLLRVLKHKPTAIRMSGGACNSAAWVQMFADVLGITVETVAVKELGGLGGAICASVGLGVYRDFNEASAHMTKVAQQFTPNPEQSAIYDKKYQAYSAMLDVLDSGWNVLRTMQRELED
ncbi:FGGY-family carbohydrate kinase [Bifidobacterium aquikefiri]|uniref:FGGY-family carbohydrate kinase n=1 Tax=Bifidobacterium aquikefiri TaxID=1653207 RepID=UPI0023F005F8|nr:FGGY-family carbohydrate kinase [Bifidobacterium aquikefiri]